MSPEEIFLILVLSGVVLIAAEIFIPGGVLGTIGFLELAAAVFVGFYAFGARGGMFALAGLFVFSITFMIIWVKVFPSTPIGKRLTLNDSTKTYKANPDEQALMDVEGSAVSDLRPAGIAKLDGRRVDVAAETEWIPSGTAIKVVKVEGNRITVRKIS